MRVLLSVVLAGTLALTFAGTARADGDKDEFETSWFGIRPEFWYSPALGLQAQVGGKFANLPGTLPTQGSIPSSLGLNLPTRFDANKDLGVNTNTPFMSELPQVPGPLGLEIFADTRWVSLSAWGVLPFSYHGHTTISENITVDGFTFSATRPVETTLEQALAGFDVKVNLLNNRFVRLSPVLAVRALAINWTVKDTGVPPIPGSKVSTDDVKLPLTVGRFQVLPYPEIGGEIRGGYRDYVEADFKLTGMYVSLYGVAATSFLADGGITGYVPVLPYVGLRVGYRYYYIHARTTNEKATHSFDAQMRLSGLTFSVIARF